MTFILRRISTTNSGREIARDTALDGDRLTLGRAAENGIQIEDLAVNPLHATISSADGRSVHIAAEDGLGFDLNGRSATVADVDSQSGGELRFGSHRLTIGREGDAIILTAQRIGELSEAAKDRDEARSFSLQGTVFGGKRLGAWAFAALVLLAFLVGPIWAFRSYQGVDERPEGFHADSAWSSGALSKGHAKLKDDCQSCHVQAFVAVRDSACVACHDDSHGFDHADVPTARLLAAQAPPGRGERVLASFAESFNKPKGRCVACHTEHEGAGAMPPTPQQFCSTCHEGMAARLGTAGLKTALGDAGDFGASHPQFKPRVMIAPGAKPAYARISFDARPADLSGLKFPHDVHLKAGGGVARMAMSLSGQYRFESAAGGKGLQCGDCHVATPDGVRFQPVDMEKQCAMCHSLTFEEIGGTRRTLRHGEPAQVIADLSAYYRSTPPARPIELGGMARRRPGQFAEGAVYNIYFREVAVRPTRASDAVAAVFSKGGACYDCHTIFAPASGNDWRVMKVHQADRYFTKGWFTHNKHDTFKCTDCHDASGSRAASDLLVPDVKNCRTCHVGESGQTDPAIQVVRNPTVSSCAMCHEYHADGSAPWEPKVRRTDVRDITALPPSSLYIASFRQVGDKSWHRAGGG
ncbi:MAG: hypothetical protein RLZZ58_1361 [Pseudomonadota bacterium]